MPITIRVMHNGDWPTVRAVFQEGIDTGVASLETRVPSWADWDWGHLKVCRLVAVRQDVVVGWAALSPVSRRLAYAGVAEVSVYVAASARRQGVGRALLRQLIDHSERAGLWTLQAVILAENQASVALHRACGFRLVGHREKIGLRQGQWHDTVLMERRSPALIFEDPGTR